MNMQDALSTAARKERRMNAHEVFELLDSISRTRALTDAETTELSRAIKIIDGLKAPPQSETHSDNAKALRWTAEMDKRLNSLRKQGKTFSRIATLLGVTKGAAGARWHRMNPRAKA